MTIKDLTIDPASVRVKWQEQYVSQGVNERGLANLPGIYKGFFLEPTFATPDGFLHIRQNFSEWFYKAGTVTGIEDLFDCSFALYSDEDLGYACSVRETLDIDIDLSTLNIAVDQEYLIWLEVDYVATGAATTAQYRVSDDPATDHPHKTTSAYYNKNAIIIGLVTNKHATTISFAYADVDYTRPDNRSYPLPFMMDSTFYGTEDTDLTFDYLENIVDAIAGGMADWDPAVWPYGLLSALERTRLPTTDQKAAMHGANSPDSGNVFGTMGDVDEKINIIEPSVSTSNYQLIQRINGGPLDANVTKDTISIYVSIPPNSSYPTEFVMIIGGYLDDIYPYKVYAGTGSNDRDVTAYHYMSHQVSATYSTTYLPSGMTIMVKDSPTVGSSWGFFVRQKPNYASWDSYNQMTPGKQEKKNMPAMLPVNQTALMELFGSRDERDSVVAQARLLVYADEGAIWITYNAKWNGTTFEREEGGNVDSRAILIDDSVSLLFKSAYESATPWSKTGWTSKHVFQEYDATHAIGGYYPVYNCMVGYGDLYEKVLLTTAKRDIYASGSTYGDIWSLPANYRNRWDTYPTTLALVNETTSGIDSSVAYSWTQSTEGKKWGCRVSVTTTTFSASTIKTYMGELDVTS